MYLFIATSPKDNSEWILLFRISGLDMPHKTGGRIILAKAEITDWFRF